MKHSYKIYGWVTTEIQVEAGILELSGNVSLKAVYNIASQIFEYPEGIYIRRIK